MKNKIILVLCLFTLCLLSPALPVPAAVAETKSIGEPGREFGKPSQLKNVYFGEQHVHTRNSFEAFTAGMTMTWREGKSK